MKQATLSLKLSAKKTRKQVLLDPMEQMVPWAELVELIVPYYSEGKTGRPPARVKVVVASVMQPSAEYPSSTPNGASV